MRFQKYFTMLLCGSLLLGAAACSGKHYSRQENGIVVNIPSVNDDPAMKVRLQVVNEKIIRVSATPDEQFPEDASLIIVPQNIKLDFYVAETDSDVTVRTSEISAQVNLNDGHVSFYGKDGKLILAENPGRSFIPYEADSVKSYSVRQTFSSPDDSEGLYGLGQHQADEFNYKGKNEELFQYNTKVSVPFVVSTSGYGILWDSYSLLRFGQPDDYLQLGDAFKLYDKDGVEGALTGVYTPRNGQKLVRREDKIYFEHLIRGDLGHVVNLPQDFPFYGSKVVYEGEIEPDTTGVYDFIQYYSGYQKIYLGDSLVVPERWRTAWNPNSYKFSVNLEKGKRTPIRIEWDPNGGTAYCGLRVYKPISDEQRNQMSWWGQMQDQIDYYFIAGDVMDDVISGYRTLTGKASIMPKWAMGFWQSREKYNTRDEVLSTLAEYRRRQLPIDNIVIDWLHWPQDSWGSHEFDPARFPDPKGMVDSIHAMHGRVMVSVWPKFYATTEHFKEFDEKGWMYRQAIQDSIRDWVGPGYLGSFYDAYNPDARKLFWHQMEEHYYPLGIDAWWMDASEPNLRDCTDIEYRKDLCGPTYLGPSDKYFNAYALVNADAIYNGQRGIDPDRRVFLLTRSGFAGLQRYSTATWSGDVGHDWATLRRQIAGGLGQMAAGLPWWTYDAGGFFRPSDQYENKEYHEIFLRWLQTATFLPLMRVHGYMSDTEPWRYGPETDTISRKYIGLRYRLLPYIYSNAARVSSEGYTLMRPLVMDFPADEEALRQKYQYMFGPSILVSPIVEPGVSQWTTYLPGGTDWYDFRDGRRYSGGKEVTTSESISTIPVFVRAGSILPLGASRQYTSENPDAPTDIIVYPGGDASFTLYEDEGDNYNYEHGAFSTVTFTWDEGSRTLSIGDRRGSYQGMPATRVFNITAIDGDSINIKYDGNPVKMKL